MKFGLTKGEDFLKRHTVEYIPLKEIDTLKKDVALGLTVLIVTFLGVLLINVFLIPLTTAHADGKMLSDREQEVLYCRAVLHGAEVTGGTESEITKHCARFI